MVCQADYSAQTFFKFHLMDAALTQFLKMKLEKKSHILLFVLSEHLSSKKSLVNIVSTWCHGARVRH